MQHTDISELMKNYSSYMDKDITVCGWIKSVRDSKQTCFIELNDGTGMKNVQIVIDKTTFTDESVMKQNVGAALEVKGKVVKSLNEKQPFEISPEVINVLGASPSDYPLQKKAHSLEFLRTIPHLRVRTNTFNAMFRLRSALAVAIHDFFRSENFTYVHTPIITGSDCEGAGEVFRVTTQPANAKFDTDEDYFAQDFFEKESRAHGVRSVGRRNYGYGTEQDIYIRTHFQGREFQHGKTRRRVLADRTGSGICGFERHYRFSHKDDKIHHKSRFGHMSG